MRKTFSMIGANGVQTNVLYIGPDPLASPRQGVANKSNSRLHARLCDRVGPYATRAKRSCSQTVIEGSHLAIIDLKGAESPFIVVVSTTPLTLE
jgi:hypothetical protein